MLPPHSLLHHQDKEKVLQDVRAIISQQLGADLDKVRGASLPLRQRTHACELPLPSVWAHTHARTHARTHAPTPQVNADSKFVDLGADSLDTVRWCC